MVLLKKEKNRWNQQTLRRAKVLRNRKGKLSVKLLNDWFTFYMSLCKLAMNETIFYAKHQIYAKTLTYSQIVLLKTNLGQAH